MINQSSKLDPDSVTEIYLRHLRYHGATSEEITQAQEQIATLLSVRGIVPRTIVERALRASTGPVDIREMLEHYADALTTLTPDQTQDLHRLIIDCRFGLYTALDQIQQGTAQQMLDSSRASNNVRSTSGS